MKKKGAFLRVLVLPLGSNLVYQLFYHHRLVTSMYPSLEHQLLLLDELMAAGMSSDEEQIVGQHKQYAVIEPAWRSDIVISWLRIFDALYAHAKRSGLFGGQRGAQPQMRVTMSQKTPTQL